ncbi:MAG: cytochrome c [Acidimicrobiales bacterium]|nr:MAG: cytochrome c [Acidimicrobiales bacterium]
MTVHRAAGGRLGRWSAGALVTAVLAAGAGACGADSNDGTSSGRGAAIYGANCASCHGAALEGTSRGPSLSDPVYDETTDADVRNAVRNGVEEIRWEFGPMPAMGGLSDAQIDEIVTFVRASRSAGVSITTP